MYNVIKVGDKEVPMMSMASVDLYFKTIFHEDPMKIQSKPDFDTGDLLDFISKMGFVMAKFAELKSRKEMLKLNEDAKKWTESMQCFTNCGECVCFHKNRDENGEWRFTDEKTDDGYCSVWKTMMMETEFCSRGAMNN